MNFIDRTIPSKLLFVPKQHGKQEGFVIMNIKAALLSAFVVPGLGQVVKGHKIKGFIIITLVNIFLLAAFFLVLQTVGHLMASKVSGANDPAVILDFLKSRSPAARWLLAGFFGLWFFSVIDAGRDKI